MEYKNIEMVIFDMAGTTINEDNLVYKTLHKSINQAGYNFTLDNVLEQGAGKEKKQAIRSVLKTFDGVEDENLVNQIYDDFIISLTNAYAEAQILPQPNVLQLFSHLKQKNILTVLNTGYDRTTATSIVEKLGWKIGVEFDALVTASDVPRNRPEPDMIEFAMKQFNITNSKNVVKIGDSTIDIMEGKNAGCGLSIGITTGAHTLNQLQTANPDFIINDLMEVSQIIN
ncbi:HAD hydrolase-like protein [Pedobacter sp. MC2016-05]|uniref:HAD hydrolase-like protein n=1 Tax=Pedobacter sp. MC2016-05 TaxID=2994474 RepID=UPI002245FB9E|nr:HAD hydrolase-like protein [Pedobacter sp. MC2016-05]MCX2476987.1 HAD hydrolase-like protein [Pedobacter sp. MC2016-05]